MRSRFNRVFFFAVLVSVVVGCSVDVVLGSATGYFNVYNAADSAYLFVNPKSAINLKS